LLQVLGGYPDGFPAGYPAGYPVGCPVGPKRLCNIILFIVYQYIYMELKHGDCLEQMKNIETNSIDLLFCDLPYGQTSCKWDCLIDLDLFWKEVNRICKDTSPMFFYVFYQVWRIIN